MKIGALFVFSSLLAGGLDLHAENDPLFDAVQRRDQKSVVSLIASGVNVNTAREDGSTPLAWAVQRDDSEIVSALLSAGANVNAVDENGERLRSCWPPSVEPWRSGER
ncbi:MAG: ankyrin repeat domain-containing protein [Acidobacteriota bacterium]